MSGLKWDEKWRRQFNLGAPMEHEAKHSNNVFTVYFNPDVDRRCWVALVNGHLISENFTKGEAMEACAQEAAAQSLSIKKIAKGIWKEITRR